MKQAGKRSRLGPLPRTTVGMVIAGTAVLGAVSVHAAAPAFATSEPIASTEQEGDHGNGWKGDPGDGFTGGYGKESIGDHKAERKDDHRKDTCIDIDSVFQQNDGSGAEDRQFNIVAKGGKVLVGEQDKGEANGQGFTWVDLSVLPGFPKGACAVSITVDESTAYAELITTNGTVFQTEGEVDGDDFTWNTQWFKVFQQPWVALP
ncbi:hypothetical protein QTQ03_09390 [Micromonospora sp. WMMA1363]|uniref:hypothetical protein n=1 Tax=Micromonospora sp. WMMA1363 TaxID=3053985 RepID=UPI00259D2AFC|nr:hypothetical protein [Micromonospora sp. WMMA1363]MDM4719780.1 hypothetical protein [Micromonospora sp. WMMA1363]